VYSECSTLLTTVLGASHVESMDLLMRCSFVYSVHVSSHARTQIGRLLQAVGRLRGCAGHFRSLPQSGSMCGCVCGRVCSQVQAALEVAYCSRQSGLCSTTARETSADRACVISATAKQAERPNDRSACWWQ